MSRKHRNEAVWRRQFRRSTPFAGANMTIHVDAIFEFLVEYLARIAHDEQARRQSHGADLYVPHQLDRYWSLQGVSSSQQTDAHVSAFYDAVAELCRLGVLRMGYRNPS